MVKIQITAEVKIDLAKVIYAISVVILALVKLIPLL